MTFRILGPLQVDGADVTAARDRIVLAVLLLNAGREVSVATLIEAVWEHDPPPTVRAQLQTCVSRLRRGLPSGHIRTGREGYRIEVGAGDLDAAAFTGLVSAARRAAGPDRARGLLREALALWRGETLNGIDSPVVRRMAAGWDEQYGAAAEDWIHLEIDRGCGRDLIADIAGLVRRFPFRERLRAQLMTALCQAGRQADALAAYREAWSAFHDELGIAPGAGLQDLHRQILSGRWVAAGPADPAPVRTLPRAVGDFTGRTRLVGDLLDAAAKAPGGPRTILIDGMAGIGKTSLALHLAALVGDRHPDAHLFVDLHGHSERDAVDPAAALWTLLHQLGVDAERIPAGTEERVTLWRTEVARRSVLLVLDNAAGSAQVLTLLPGSGDSLTLVTSRRRLAGVDGVAPTSLPVLDPDEATRLFTRIVGARATAEPDAVAEVVRRCGALPLAIRLAAARITHRPHWRVADLARRLRDAALTELAVEDRTVRAAFGLSYAQLPGRQQRLLRLVSRYPGERFDVTAAAALADLAVRDAENGLDALLDAHLVEMPAPGEFRLHDLIRTFAAGLPAAEPGESRDAALRLFDHALHCAATVTWPLESRMSRRTRQFPPPRRPELLPGPDVDDIAWFDRHRHDHLAILRMAEEQGAHRYVWMLARSAWRLWYLRAAYPDLVDAHRRGVAAARAVGDHSAAAVMTNYLASGLHRLGQVRAAATALETLRAAALERGNPVRPAYLSNLAVLRLALGDVRSAVDCATEALDLARRYHDPALTAAALNALGLAESRRGHLTESLAWHRREWLVAIASGNTVGRYMALTNVAVVRMRLGHEPAERLLRLAVALSRRVGNMSELGETLSALAVHQRRKGRIAEAIDLHRAAVESARDYADTRLRAAIHVDFGETMRVAGDTSTAADLLRQAHAWAREAEDGYEEARSLDAWAATIAPADPATAGAYWRRALALFRGINVTRAEAVGQRLAALGSEVCGPEHARAR